MAKYLDNFGLSHLVDKVETLLGYKQNKAKMVTVTLLSTDWTNNEQNVYVNGISTNETKQIITPVPKADNQTEYYSCGIVCSNQSYNNLTFKADEVPTSNLTVYVVIQEV